MSVVIDEIFRGRVKIYGDLRIDVLYGVERGVLFVFDILNLFCLSIGSFFIVSWGSVGSFFLQVGIFFVIIGFCCYCSMGCNKLSFDWFYLFELQFSGGIYFNLVEMF